MQYPVPISLALRHVTVPAIHNTIPNNLSSLGIHRLFIQIRVGIHAQDHRFRIGIIRYKESISFDGNLMMETLLSID